jgi:ABC-type amino acid transport system permease subunit
MYLFAAVVYFAVCFITGSMLRKAWGRMTLPIDCQ